MKKSLIVITSLLISLGLLFWVVALKYIPNEYEIYLYLGGMLWLVLDIAWYRKIRRNIEER